MSMIIEINGVPREVPREIVNNNEAVEQWVKEQHELEPSDPTSGEATTVTPSRKRRSGTKESET